jgi:predicted CXXCH cytochrome family protein
MAKVKPPGSRPPPGKPTGQPLGDKQATASELPTTSPRPWRWLLSAVALALVAGLALWWMRPSADPLAQHDAEAARPATPSVATSAPAAYVDNATCESCHEAETRLWQQSHHAMAMAEATPATVLGDFNDARFEHAGVVSRFFQRDGKYFVNTDGPDGKLADFEVSYTFGVHPLQQYLIAMPGGRLQPLQIAWDVPRRKWFRLIPDEKAPPGDVLHWTGRYQTANTMCITCHTTAFEKRYDAGTDTFASTWQAANVSCQACHGPGGAHLEWARRNAEGKLDPDQPVPARHGLPVTLDAANAKLQVDVCSPCHSRRSELTAVAVPGEPRLDHYLPALLTEGPYHADGQQLEEVFVDGSYRQSRMYLFGVACTACHDAHSGKLTLAGDAVCLQCHGETPNPSFPSAAGQFATPEHHHHQPGTPGAQCVDCHMPAKNYMLIQPRPDHSLRVPRPDLSVKIGTPNACNDCHADRPPQWAAEQVATWYGPERRQEPHFGEALAAARSGQPGANEGLVRLVADPLQPAIVRATALAELDDDPTTGISERIAATRDADPEVRAAAAASLRSAPAQQRLDALGPLLRDPLRAVRVAAASSLASLPAARFDASTRSAFDAALAEYIAAQQTALDMPGARLNLAVLYQDLGQADVAEGHYLAALGIDPDFTPARANLARLYNAGGRNADAERVLTEGLQRQPRIGELQYMLGLLLGEQGRLEDAAGAFAKAAELMPGHARVHYNLGLALQHLGRTDGAEKALATAQRLEPGAGEYAYALAVFYAQNGRREEALEWASQLLLQRPDDPQVQQLVRQLAAGATRR